MVNIFIHVGLLLLGGVLGAANFIIAKNPSSKETIDKLRPAKGGIGIAMLIFGLIALLYSLRWIGYLFKYVPLTALIFLSTFIVEILLGALLGYELIAQYTLKGNAEAEQKGEALRANLAKYQVPLGIAAIVLSIILLVRSFSSSLGI